MHVIFTSLHFCVILGLLVWFRVFTNIFVVFHMLIYHYGFDELKLFNTKSNSSVFLFIWLFIL